MEYQREIRTKDGRRVLLRNAVGTDAESFIAYFVQAHGETDYLTTYPDECSRDVTATAEDLEEKRKSGTEIEICAFLDGVLVGSAGIGMIRDRAKTRHRAEFGISILKDYWGLGIGDALTKACIETAREAGFLQLELDAVAENESALRLYRKNGFVEYGRNPRAFRTRQGQWQALVMMCMEL